MEAGDYRVCRLVPTALSRGAGPWLQEGRTRSVMGQQPTLISEAYGRALNFWEPPSSDTATGTKANTWSQAAVSAEASAPHSLARDLPKVGGAMSGATQNLGGAG